MSVLCSLYLSESIQGIASQSQMLRMSTVRIVKDEATIALTGAALHSVGPIPRKNVPIPSLRYDFRAQSRALEYFRPGPMTSVCNRDLITSVVSQNFQTRTDRIRRQPHCLAGSILRRTKMKHTRHRKDTTSTQVCLFY